MSRGLFITFEGGEGSGKSTIIEMLSKSYEEIEFTREPGGSNISEKIREIILDKNNTEMDNRCEALLYAASRAQHIEEYVKPSIKKGITVICDRYVESSLVYQGMARDNSFEDIKSINEFATQGFSPDITIFFDVSPDVGLKRVEGRNKIDRLDLEKMEFHNKIYDGYMELFNKKLYTSKRYYIVDATQSVDRVFKMVQDIIFGENNE